MSADNNAGSQVLTEVPKTPPAETVQAIFEPEAPQPLVQEPAPSTDPPREMQDLILENLKLYSTIAERERQCAQLYSQLSAQAQELASVRQNVIDLSAQKHAGWIQNHPSVQRAPQPGQQPPQRRR